MIMIIIIIIIIIIIVSSSGSSIKYVLDWNLQNLKLEPTGFRKKNVCMYILVHFMSF